MSVPTRESVLDFIRHFHFADRNGEVTETFTQGCCYWFAVILILRFNNATIVYDPKENHFAAEIGLRYYDITGEITEPHEWIPFWLYADETHKARILRDCVFFETDVSPKSGTRKEK